MSKEKPSLRARLRYRFENTLSAGTIAVIGWLAVVSFVIIFFAALIIQLLGISQEENKEIGFFEGLWLGLMHAIDAGTLGGDNGLAYRSIMLIVTIGGIFIFSTLIGVLTSGFSDLIEELRKGKTKVLESGHTLILGWSPKIFDIISELITANESQKKSRIVILSNKDKVEMEDEIRAKISDMKTTRIICRTGSPLEITDIDVANPNEAKSIIIIAPDDEPEPDTHVIKSVLALTNHPNRKSGKYHLVAEVAEEDNIEAAALVGGDETSFIFVEDLLSRITAQTCRQSGLSVVYTELLNFDGAEIYFKEEPNWVGKSFKEVLFGYDQSAVFGIQRVNGEVYINPPMDMVLSNGDKVIAISEDDSTVNYAPKKYQLNDAIITKEIGSQQSLPLESTLIIGWNNKGNKIIKELDNYVAEGSKVMILCEDATDVSDKIEALKATISRQVIEVKEGITTKKAHLQALNAETYDHIIVLSNENYSVQEADAKTLITLLHLRNMADIANKDFAIVSEMRDIRNKYLAEVARIDDYIVGANLISLIVAQLSENRYLRQVFDNLFSSDGSEIYIRPISDYVTVGNEEVDFYTLLESAARKGEIAIGYKIGEHANNASKAYGVVINPVKSNKIALKAEDKLIVISEK